MSFNSTYRKFPSMSALAIRIEDEGNAIIRKIAREESAKVFSIKTGQLITPRHVYNLREEGAAQPTLGWPPFILLAREYPELRKWVLEWLNADRDPAEVANDIIRFLQAREK